MPLKGTIPVADEDYDLSDPVGTGKTALSLVIGSAMMFGIFAGGRAVWNRISQETGAVGEVEVL